MNTSSTFSIMLVTSTAVLKTCCFTIAVSRISDDDTSDIFLILEFIPYHFILPLDFANFARNCVNVSTGSVLQVEAHASEAGMRRKRLTRSVMDRARQGSRDPFVVRAGYPGRNNDESSEER